jgi:hypothetical protein
VVETDVETARSRTTEQDVRTSEEAAPRRRTPKRRDRACKDGAGGARRKKPRLVHPVIVWTWVQRCWTATKAAHRGKIQRTWR